MTDRPDEPSPEPSERSGRSAKSEPEGGGEAPGLDDLEEERRFLLRSLRDLEREHEAGDVDDEDYATLHDGYTRRAAEVIRAIEDGRRTLPSRHGAAPGSWRRTAAVVVASVLIAVGIGLALAQAWGDRGSGDEITGFTPGDEVRQILTGARAALGDGAFGQANALFFEAVELEIERGVDNPEPITYYGWTLALGTRQTGDTETSDDQLDLAILSLQRAIEIDPTYADPHCFTAIVEHSFRGDSERALPFVETCLDLDPPVEVRSLIEEFADEIRAAAG